MKPNFALSLSYDAVELLQRGAGGWLSVGSVKFDRPDLDAAIEALIQRARALAPEGITTKLIVPDSEVRFASVLAPGPTDEARRYQIEAGIEGLTPYPLAELAYDWSVEGDHAQVAIVARETLREAEEFAAERGFNPVSFVAQPGDGQFLGEPFFGQTAMVRGLLPEGAMVQPDSVAVRVMGKVPEPGTGPAREQAKAPAAAAPAPAAAAPAATPAAATPAASAATAGPAPVQSGQPPARSTTPATAAPPARSPGPGKDKVAAPAGSVKPDAGSGQSALQGGTNLLGGLVRRMGTAIRREQAGTGASAVTRGSGALGGTGAASADGASRSSVMASASVTRQLPNDTLRAGGGAAALSAAAQPYPDDPPEDAPREPATQPRPEGAVLAFSSRRTAQPPAASGPKPATSGAPGGRLAILNRGGAAAGAGTGMTRGLGRRSRDLARTTLGRLGLLTTARRLLGRGPTGAALPAASVRAVPSGGPRSIPATAPQAGRGLTDPGIAGAAASGGAARGTPTDRTNLTEAEALTVFGRRGMTQPEPLLPARALMGLGALMLVLVAVAVWALYFNRPAPAPAGLAQGNAVVDDPAAAAVRPDEIAAPAQVPAAPVAPPQTETAAAPAPPEGATAPEAVAETVTETAAPQETPPQTATVDGTETTDPDAMLEALVREALSDPQQAERLESLGATDPSVAQPDSAAAPESAGGPVALNGPANDDVASGAETGAAATETAASGPPADQTAPAPQVTRLAMPGRLTVPPVDEVRPVSLSPPPAFDAVLAGIAAPAPVMPEPEPAPGGEQAGTEIGPSSEEDVTITVTPGRPVAVPTVRPARIGPPPPVIQPAPPEPAAAQVSEPEPAPEAVTEAVTEAEPEPAPEPVLADDTPRADPALAGVRPEARSARVRALGEARRAVQPDPPVEDDDGAQVEQPGRLDQGSLMPDLGPAIAGTAAPLARPVAFVAPAAAPLPGALAAAGPEASAEPAVSPPPGGVDLALLRPQRRPTDLVPDPSALEPDPVDETAPEAVARSLLPSARPQALSARVQAALEAERRRPVATAAAAAAPAAAPAPQATAAAAAPSIPSSASVQQSATERRAIRTREANLIGVFGAPSSRRALVRMGNGQVVRLQVGDRFDGGQVSAIGDSELRYVRGGRDRVLRIASRS